METRGHFWRTLVLAVCMGGTVLAALFATDQLLLPLLDQIIGPVWRKESSIDLLRRVLITSIIATLVCNLVVQLLLNLKVEALSLKLGASIVASFFASQMYYYRIGRYLDAYIFGGVDSLALSLFVTLSTVLSVILVNALLKRSSRLT